MINNKIKLKNQIKLLVLSKIPFTRIWDLSTTEDLQHSSHQIKKPSYLLVNLDDAQHQAVK